MTVILISVLGICVFLPGFIVWTISRRKMYQEKKRIEIALTFLKHNPDADLKELVKEITPKPDPITRLLPLLWCGLLFGISAIILGGVAATVPLASRQGEVFIWFITAMSATISIPSLICYRIGKHIIGKESISTHSIEKHHSGE